MDEGLAQRPQERQRLATDQQQQVRQARSAVPLAQRRYERVAPDYRLAAAELDRAWADALRALRQAEEAAERCVQAPAAPTVPPALREHLVPLSQRVPALWAREPLSHTQRKALLRSLLARVIVQRPAADRLAIKLVGGSGHGSQGTGMPPGVHQRHGTRYDPMVARIGQ